MSLMWDHLHQRGPGDRAPTATIPELPPPVLERMPARPRTPFRAGRSSVRKKSSVGLIVGLVAAGVAVVGLLCAGVGGIVYWSRNRTIAESEWQTFTPPDGSFSLQMPGTPTQSTLPVNGVNAQKYLLDHQPVANVFHFHRLRRPAQRTDRRRDLEGFASGIGGRITNPHANIGYPASFSNQHDLPPAPYPGRELFYKPAKAPGTLIERA